MDKKQLRAAIDEGLVAVADPILLAAAFTRKKRTFRYRRCCPAGEQWVAVDYTLPRYSDDPTLCHIKPGVGASFPEVNDKAVHLVDGSSQLVGFSPEVTYALPLGLCGPERALKEWRPAGFDDLHNQLQDMVAYLERFGLPFLDEYRTSESLVRGYHDGDQRFMKGNTFVLRVVAAALCTDQGSIAREVAESALGGSPGMRRRYTVLFDRLGATESQ